MTVPVEKNKKSLTFISLTPPLPHMGQIHFVFLFLVIAIVVSGCSQQSPPVVTPTPSLTTLPVATDTTPVPAAKKQIDVSALQSGSDIIVRYNGGVDSADLAALEISIQSYNNLQSQNERENNPVTGQRYVFPNMGTASQNTVTVTGIFRDGTKQTLLQTKV
jgi:hypothetical protein